MTLRLAINGALGRMGRALGLLVLQEPGFEIAAALEAPGSPAAGQDYGTLLGRAPLSVAVSDSLKARVDALVDFSTPVASLARLEECVKTGSPAVICTTGFDEDQRRCLRSAADRIPVLVASNTSVGIAALLRHLPALARELGDRFDIEIIEMHHRRKKDAPSGTAVTVAEAIARETGRSFPADFTFGRRGAPGEKPPREIGVHAVRGGGVIGEHTVLFASEDEVIAVTHRAGSRDLFARGALRAAAFVASAKPGYYSMDAVLG
ncbi:MAG: 4-hydroxy-tetrahydrodipicolinate reductase [Planctomycetes bacterium]|nr:4-hydroxy-tetrahydrodipicolinate reductase [Planctomycetota bacterium]